MAELIAPVLGAMRCVCGNSSLFDPLCKQFNFLKNPRSKLEKLDGKMKWLEALEADVKQKLYGEKLLHGRDPKAEVNLWLQNVEEIRTSIETIKVRFGIESERCLSGCFPNYINRVKLARVVHKKILEIDELLPLGRFPETSLVNMVPTSEPQTLLESAVSQETSQICKVDHQMLTETTTAAVGETSQSREDDELVHCKSSLVNMLASSKIARATFQPYEGNELWHPERSLVATAEIIDRHIRMSPKDTIARRSFVETGEGTELLGSKRSSVTAVPSGAQRARSLYPETSIAKKAFQFCEGNELLRQFLQQEKPEELLEGSLLVKGVPRRGWIFPESKIIGKTLQGVIERTWEYVLNREIGKIGISGMGGVGKTTVALEINNRLLRDGAPFEYVIWVTATKESNLRKIQKDIASALGLSFEEDDDEMKRAAKLLEALMGKVGFLLIIDDMWEAFYLESIGIPNPAREKLCKLIITTRSKRICHKMETDKEIEVSALSEEEGWDLFREKVGEDALSSPAIEPVAKCVARECGGLPLAIITVGRALRKETDHLRWILALNELKNSVASDDMEKQVFERLRFSYERLSDTRTKSCFLYCALYPKDHLIDTEELIRYWIWEGLLDTGNVESIKEKSQLGMSILRELKDAGMLESVYQTSDDHEYVKMHDLIRDMLIQLTRQGPISMIQAGHGLHLAPAEDRWHLNLQRVSLMRNDISLLDFAPKCPNLHTLLLQYNSLTKKMHPNFFEKMEMLRVLDLSFTGIRDLPESFSNLRNLHALLLQSCWNLKRLPALPDSSLLMVLDLSYTSIEYMAMRLDLLHNLRHLDLSHAQVPYVAANNLLKCRALENLLVLGLRQLFKVKFASLVRVLHLSVLEINFWTLKDFSHYIQSSTWRHLESFKFCIGSSDPNIMIQQNGIAFLNVCFDEKKGPSRLFGRMNQLVLDRCKQVTNLPNYIELASSQLKRCKIRSCPDMEWIVSAELSTFPSLEWLEIEGTSKLTKLCKEMQDGTFASLRMLHVNECCSLKALLPLQLVQYLTRLEEIEIQNCENIEEIVSEREEDEEMTDICTAEVNLPSLNKLKLSCLPALKIISNTVILCDSLSAIEVRNCPKLDLSLLEVGHSSLVSS